MFSLTLQEIILRELDVSAIPVNQHACKAKLGGGKRENVQARGFPQLCLSFEYNCSLISLYQRIVSILLKVLFQEQINSNVLHAVLKASGIHHSSRRSWKALLDGDGQILIARTVPRLNKCVLEHKKIATETKN